MLRTLGADLVGMSTVHETIAARAAGPEVLGLSLVTNLAAGMTGQPISHDEVLEAGRSRRRGWVPCWPRSWLASEPAGRTPRASSGAANSISSTRSTCAAMMNVTFDPVSTAVASTA